MTSINATDESASSAPLSFPPLCHPEWVCDSSLVVGRVQRGIPITFYSMKPLSTAQAALPFLASKKQTTRLSSRCLEDRQMPTSINMKPDNVFYQRLQPDFLAGFLAAFFLVDRLAGLRALFFALRAVFFLRVAMIPPSGMLGIIIGEKCQMYARDFGESSFAAKRV